MLEKFNVLGSLTLLKFPCPLPGVVVTVISPSRELMNLSSI